MATHLQLGSGLPMPTVTLQGSRWLRVNGEMVSVVRDIVVNEDGVSLSSDDWLAEAARAVAENEVLRKDIAAAVMLGANPDNPALPDIRRLAAQAWHDQGAVWPLIDRILESRERPKKMRMYRWQTTNPDTRPQRTAIIFSDLEPSQVVVWLDSLSEHEGCQDYAECGRYRLGDEQWKHYPERETLSDFLLLICGDGGIPWRGLPTALLSWLAGRVTERRVNPDDTIHSNQMLRDQILAPAGELARRDWETDER